MCIHTLTTHTQPCKSLFKLFVLAVCTCFCYSPVDIFRNVISTANTKPAHTPHTIVQLHITWFLFSFPVWILSCIFQHTKQSFIASDDLKSILWREISHRTHRLLRPAWEQQPVWGTSSFCESNRRREVTVIYC